MSNLFKISSGKTEISVIIPLLNEEGNLAELSESVKSTMVKLNKSYEIIFIDDGSTDRSPEVLKEIFDKNKKHVTVISFRGNYGKSAALSCGFKHAKGDIVITMDADLQDGPENIGNLLSKLNEGYDLVTGWRKKRNDPALKVALSRIYNACISKLSGITLHDFNCGLKAMRGQTAKEIVVYGELHRYIPILARWRNFKVTEIPVEHHRRKSGVSKYKNTKILAGFLDILTVMLITKYSQKPSRVFGSIGFFLSLMGVIILIYIAVGHFYFMYSGDRHFMIRERPIFTLSIFSLIMGMQFLSIGLIAEMINISRKHGAAAEEFSVKSILKS